MQPLAFKIESQQPAISSFRSVRREDQIVAPIGLSDLRGTYEQIVVCERGSALNPLPKQETSIAVRSTFAGVTDLVTVTCLVSLGLIALRGTHRRP